VLPRDKAIGHIKEAIRKSYGSKGEAVVQANFRAVDETLERLFEVAVPESATGQYAPPPLVPSHAPAFVRDVTAAMLEGRGDDIPVSHLPVDGTWPSGTAIWEKRNISDAVPVWDAETCNQCGQCSFVCPHGVIQAKYFDAANLSGAPAHFLSAPINVRGFPDVRFTLDFSIEDCTGCGLCVEACPVVPRKSLEMHDKEPLVADGRTDNAFFATLPVNDRARVDFANVRGVQFLEPLFAYSGACAGCGETPYL
jgi:pyruvate-ferredoxin/flavodoxin oxidoreductase